jgi:hypothetical protein
MRYLAALALSAALVGCTQPARETAGSSCTRSATHEVTWSNANAPDTITASSEGPSCAQAIITLSIRNAAGDALWAYAETHYALTAGDGLPAAEQPAISTEQMDEFLSGLARVSEMRSSTLPEWREGVATLSESAQTFAYDTPFDRETYEMLRGRDLPMLCYAAAAEASDCLIIDPFSRAPTRIVSFGP